jgi:proline iminopeptidase
LRRKELLWFYQEGASNVFPDAWERFVAAIAAGERHDMIAAYYERLTSNNRKTRLEAARAWSVWEGSTLSLLPNPEREARFGEDDYALAFARIECHYFVNAGFFEYDGQLIAEIGKCRHVPAVIVQGRYDMVTPVQTAWDLHIAWPEADFRLVPDTGHTATDPGNVHELISATDRFRYR